MVQRWSVVQRLPSSHGPLLGACWQTKAPPAEPQMSTVHGFPSSQSGGGPPTHVPPAQWSAVVHGWPSSHGAVLFWCWQTKAALAEPQLSLVHALPSSHAATWVHTKAPSGDAMLGPQKSQVDGTPSEHGSPNVHGVAWPVQIAPPTHRRFE